MTALSSKMDRQQQENGCTEYPPLTILIPAYNEQERIKSTLCQYQDYLMQWQGNFSQTSILVVDDGSTDETYQVVDEFGPQNIGAIANRHDKQQQITVQCIRMPQNGGKGAALAYGTKYIMENENVDDGSIEPLILTQDADGSGDLGYLSEMLEKLYGLLQQQDGNLTEQYASPAMVTGSRNYNFFSARGVTRWGFQTVVKLIMNDLRVQDSQCGYKLMTLAAAKMLYDNLHLQGWSHDVEVLYRAKLFDIPIAEIPIDWEDKDGSKVVASGVAKVSLQMLLDVIRLRWNYSITKIWR